MVKVTITEYLDQQGFSEASRPSDMTVRRMIQTGKLPGEKIGGRWFVKVNSSGDDKADEIARKWGLL